MNLELVDRLVNAVLYEGYILYPYRPSSTKNQRRFTFGRVYPYAFSQVQRAAEPFTMQTQCLLQHHSSPENLILTGKIRILHLMDRSVGWLPEPLTAWSEGVASTLQPVSAIRIGER